jgi:hypothetical protein
MAQNHRDPHEFGAFISHSAKDVETAQQICASLEARDIPCWIAPRNVDAGREWAEEIVRGIEASASLVLLVSRNSNASAQVAREVEQALRRERPVFPVILEKVLLTPRLDYYIAPIHWLRYSAGATNELADALRAAIQGDAKWLGGASPPGLGRRIRSTRYGFVSILAVGVLAALLIGAMVIGFFADKMGREQAETDLSELSLGFVSLQAGESKDSGPNAVNGTATLYLYGNDTPHNAIRLQIAGVGGRRSQLLDLSGAIPPGIGAGALQIPFSAETLSSQVVVCLTLPHPRRKVLYRVRQLFRVTAVSNVDGDRTLEFARNASPNVTPDHGAPCLLPPDTSATH